MPDIPSLLQPLKDRLAAATPGRLVAEHRNQLDWLSSSQYINSDGHQAGSMIHQGDKGNPIWGSTWPHRNAQATADLFANAPTDQATLIAAVEAVEKIHKPVKIYDECDCPEGTHPEDYDYIDCSDYVGCDNSLTGIGCDECCVEAWDSLTQDCGENHTHVLDPSKRCPTVRALTQARVPSERQHFPHPRAG
jgi:hypothetical protein